MATPFSPFCYRVSKQPIRKRQSQLPSDLIDWEAPEIPELEKQKIVYEDYIKDLEEDNHVEQLLQEQIFLVVHDNIIQEYQEKLKGIEDDHQTKILALQQDKDNLLTEIEKLNEVENDNRSKVLALQQDKENLLNEIENLNFKNHESMIELNQEKSLNKLKDKELNDVRKKNEGLKTKLIYYKELCKKIKEN